MENNGRNKRTRREVVESDSTLTTPTTQTTPVHVVEAEGAASKSPRDQRLEEEMERLGVDEELKASLRLMSPDERTEVLNDIIRSQEQGEHSAGVSESEGRSSLFGGFPVSMLFADGDAEVFVADGIGGVIGHMAQLFAGPPQRRTLESEPNESSGNDGTESPMRGMHALRSRTGSFRSNAIYHRIIRELIRQSFMGLPHDVDNMTYEQLLELQEQIGVVSKGLTPEQIQQCMKDVPRPAEGSCVVCQTEWQESEEGDRCVELNVCNHVFHNECIEQWLKCNKTCPVCKREVL